MLPPAQQAPAGVGLPFALVRVRGDRAYELVGAEVGGHARSAVGMADMPFNMPLEIEAEVEIRA